jgi:hypothetical protein
MFRVTAANLRGYFNYDPERRTELEKLDRLIVAAAPTLKRHFHRGTPAGEAGMRMQMIGYGEFRYAIKSGKTSPWPIIGVALQKNYISVYISVTRGGSSVVKSYVGKLGELRAGGNNFSFEKFDELDTKALASLFREVETIVRSDPDNPVRYKQRERRRRAPNDLKLMRCPPAI